MLSLIAMSSALCACARSSAWADLRFEVDAVVDGRPVHASTLWRTKFTEGFLDGMGTQQVSGVALALPIAPGHNVYGLFKSVIRNGLQGWGALPTGLDGYVSAEDQQLGRPAKYSKSASRFRDYTVERLNGRRIEFCLPEKTGLGGQERCPVFVYFSNPADPNSVEMLKPGDVAEIDSHRVKIVRVTFTFVPPGGQSQSTPADLPAFLDKPGHALGSIPRDRVEGLGLQLQDLDFRRKE